MTARRAGARTVAPPRRAARPRWRPLDKNHLALNQVEAEAHLSLAAHAAVSNEPQPERIVSRRARLRATQAVLPPFAVQLSWNTPRPTAEFDITINMFNLFLFHHQRFTVQSIRDEPGYNSAFSALLGAPRCPRYATSLLNQRNALRSHSVLATCATSDADSARPRRQRHSLNDHIETDD